METGYNNLQSAMLEDSNVTIDMATRVNEWIDNNTIENAEFTLEYSFQHDGIGLIITQGESKISKLEFFKY